MVKHRRYVTLMLLYIELKFLLIFSQAIRHFHRLLQFCRVKLFPGFLCGCLSCGHSILPLFAMRFLVVNASNKPDQKSKRILVTRAFVVNVFRQMEARLAKRL